MTDQAHTPADDGDASRTDKALIDKLALLRNVKPSPEAHARLQELVAEELSAARLVHPTPWWRRSIQVPVPVCMAAGLALFALLLFKLPGAPERSLTSEPNTKSHVAAPANVEVTSKPTLQITSRYMLGVGELGTEIRAFSHEDQR